MERVKNYALYGWYDTKKVGDQIYLLGDISDEGESPVYAIFDNEQDFLYHLYKFHGVFKELSKGDIRVYMNEPNNKKFFYIYNRKYIDKFGFFDSYYSL